MTAPLTDPWDSPSYWRNDHHAKRIELEHNLQYPEMPIRVEVIDTLATNPLVDRIFNSGLIVIPCLFLLSVVLWLLSLLIFRSFFEYCALIVVSAAVILFLIFGLLFFIGMCSGIEYQYHPREVELVGNGVVSRPYRQPMPPPPTLCNEDFNNDKSVNANDTNNTRNANETKNTTETAVP